MSDRRYDHMVVFNGRDIRKFQTKSEAQDFIDRNQSTNLGSYSIREIEH